MEETDKKARPKDRKRDKPRSRGTPLKKAAREESVPEAAPIEGAHARVSEWGGGRGLSKKDAAAFVKAVKKFGDESRMDLIAEEVRRKGVGDRTLKVYSSRQSEGEKMYMVSAGNSIDGVKALEELKVEERVGAHRCGSEEFLLLRPLICQSRSWNDHPRLNSGGRSPNPAEEWFMSCASSPSTSSLRWPQKNE